MFHIHISYKTYGQTLTIIVLYYIIYSNYVNTGDKMSKTIKQIADELGVSKQAVYKRATGKLKSVLEPYIYKEYNYTCVKDEGVAIIKKDFEENPCATPRDLTPDYSVNTPENSAAYTEHIGSVPNPHTEYIDNTSVSHTPQYTEQIGNISASDTERIDFSSVQHTEQIGNTPESHTPSDTERIGNTSVSHTDIHTYIIDENERLKTALEETTTELHQKELAFVKKEAETEKLEAIIAQLNERLKEKDDLIEEQRIAMEKTENERKVLTLSLFKNNEFIEKILRMSLTKRIFGWKTVQKELIDSQNVVVDDINKTGE